MNDLMSMPPFLPLILAGLLLPLLPRAFQKGLLLAAPLAGIAAIFSLQPDDSFALPILNASPVHFLALKDYAVLFGLAFCLTMFGAAIFGLNTVARGEAAAALLATGAALGIVYAGDMISFFLFWELLAVASAYLIFVGGFKASSGAARRYLILHIFGGALLLAGIAGIIVDSGTATFPLFHLAPQLPEWTDLPAWAPWLIFLGVMVNLAAPPFSVWLPDSYPEASGFGMIVLSALTTKSAVFVMLELFAGSSVLLWVGYMMLFYGTIYAFMQNDIRRMLGYAIIAQTGVMAIAVGIGTPEALAGAAVLAFSHIAYKGLLVTTAGCVIHQTGKRRFHHFGGLWKVMPIPFAAAVIGSIAMAGLPFTGAFIGKSIVHSAVDALGVNALYLLFVAGVSVATFLIFPWRIFGSSKKYLRIKKLPREMQLALGVFALVTILPGIYPPFFDTLLPNRLSATGYDAKHLIHAFEMAGFGALGFFLMRPWLYGHKGITLDIDWTYRRFALHLLMLADRFLLMLEAILQHVWGLFARKGSGLLMRAFAPAGIIADAWPIGVTVLVATALLSAFLMIYY